MSKTYKLKTVRKGSKGSDVLLVQSILKARGFLGEDGKELELDGDAGDNTMFAISSYIHEREAQGANLGADDAWGPLCYADQNWDVI